MIMPTRIAIALTLLLAGETAFAQTQNEGLKRLTLRHDLLGFEAVGRLDFPGGGFCSGVLIASDLVLTAAHCLRAAAKAGHMGGTTFRAGYRDGKAIATRQTKAGVMHPAYRPFGPMSAANVRVDIALVQLDQPIPTATAAPFAADQLPRRGREVSVVSYARGRAEALSRQATCSVLGRQSGLLAFNCNVTFGSSGAPVFDTSGPRPRIISLISAGVRSKDGVIAYGMELKARLAEVKQALRAGRGVIGSGQVGPGAPPKRVQIGNRANSGAKFVRP